MSTNAGGVSLSTPYTQKYGSDGLTKSLKTLCQTSDARYLECRKHDIPRCSDSTENLFIWPCEVIKGIAETRFRMWFILTSDKAKIIHGFDYPCVEVQPGNWIMKVEVGAGSLKNKDYLYEIGHLQPVDSMQLVELDGQDESSIRVEPYMGGETPFSGVESKEVFEKYIIPMIESIGFSRRDLYE